MSLESRLGTESGLQRRIDDAFSYVFLANIPTPWIEGLADRYHYVNRVYSERRPDFENGTYARRSGYGEALAGFGLGLFGHPVGLYMMIDGFAHALMANTHHAGAPLPTAIEYVRNIFSRPRQAYAKPT